MDYFGVMSKCSLSQQSWDAWQIYLSHTLPSDAEAMGPKTLLGVPSVKQADLPGIAHSCSLVSTCSVVTLVQVLSASPLEKHFWTNLFSTQPIYTYLTLGCPCAEAKAGSGVLVCISPL